VDERLVEPQQPATRSGLAVALRDPRADFPQENTTRRSPFALDRAALKKVRRRQGQLLKPMRPDLTPRVVLGRLPPCNSSTANSHLVTQPELISKCRSRNPGWRLPGQALPRISTKSVVAV
jgi:hypothetical protein